MVAKLSTAQYISGCKEVHGDLYDYSHVDYIRARDKIDIVCLLHGKFSQQASSHKNGQGCPSCRKNKPVSLDDLLRRSHEKYGDQYTIIPDSYVNTRNKVRLHCNHCDNSFETLADTHLHGKNGGCQICANKIRRNTFAKSLFGKEETLWLNEHLVPLRQYPLTINGKTITVDGYNPFTNTVYEYNGSFWHGNPEIYKSDDYNPVKKKTFGELYQETLSRERIIREHYLLIVKWGP